MIQRFFDRIETWFDGKIGETRAHVLMQLVRFGIVGVINTLVDFAVFSFLFYVVFSANQNYYYIPFAVGYLCGVVCSFILNKIFTFRDKQNAKRQWLPFLLVNLVALGVGQGLMYLLGLGNITGALAKLITIPVTLLINFIGSKLLVFRAE